MNTRKAQAIWFSCCCFAFSSRRVCLKVPASERASMKHEIWRRHGLRPDHFLVTVFSRDKANFPPAWFVKEFRRKFKTSNSGLLVMALGQNTISKHAEFDPDFDILPSHMIQEFLPYVAAANLHVRDLA